jgi:preprotein translocase subunit SecE
VIHINPTLPIIPATTERPKLPREVEEIFEGGFDFTITKQTTGSTEPPTTATTEEFRQAVAAADDIKVEFSEKTYLARSAGMVVVLVAFTGCLTWIVDYCQRSKEKKNVSAFG